MKQFDSVPVKIPDKNVFSLDHDVKASYNFDKLYPFLCQPVYPGDTFNCRAEVFMRAMPMFCPVMHNVDMRLYFFFVPNRLIWNENRKRDWKTFITGGEDGLQNPTLPYWTYEDIPFTLHRNGQLLDHMGFPAITKDNTIHTIANNAKSVRISSLPFRAYQMIYNEYFRNQNVQNEIEFSYDEGHETQENIRKLFQIRKKCWEKDYFTSCLPFAQRGQAVRLPIDFNVDPSASSINVPLDINQVYQKSGQIENVSNIQSDGTTTHSHLVTSSTIPSGNVSLKGTAVIDASEIAFTGLSVGTINDFRYCLRLQQWLENNARCGSRYIEQLLAHFGVVSSDARLQRPELLGGGVIPLLFTDVEQTNGQSTGSVHNVLGNLAGKGTLYGKSNGFKKYFEEHGILMGILCIIPRTSYQQQLSRVWTAFDKTDWYFPEFANLGEQAVLNHEVYFEPDSKNGATDSTAEPMGVFGYQGRFTELRYIPSSVHGDLKDTLQAWHLGRIFPVQPSLNASFVEAETRANIFSVQEISDGDYDPFVCQIHMDISAVRPLPKYAVPTL